MSFPCRWTIGEDGPLKNIFREGGPAPKKSVFDEVIDSRAADHMRTMQDAHAILSAHHPGESGWSSAEVELHRSPGRCGDWPMGSSR